MKPGIRLKAGWEEDYKVWCQRDLSQKRYVYWWADGVYFNVRLDEERTCVLGPNRSHRGWHQEIISRRRMVTGKALNPGVNCLGSSNAWGSPPHRSWPLATVRLASGSPCRK